MKIKLEKLNYNFINKPLIVGGKAKEYYNIRKSGDDIDLVISEQDFSLLKKQYPKNQKDLYGDLGIIIEEFEIWKTIVLFDYNYLSKDALEKDKYKIISLEKLFFLTALASDKPKYKEDFEIMRKLIINTQYKDG